MYGEGINTEGEILELNKNLNWWKNLVLGIANGEKIGQGKVNECFEEKILRLGIV